MRREVRFALVTEKEVIMSRGINKVTLIGNVGKDPELSYMPSGAAVTNITVATNESWTDKASGERQERTEWHNVSMFGKLAEITAEYVRSGSQIYVEGSLRTRKWQDSQGNDRYSTEVRANEMQMLGRREPMAPANGANHRVAGSDIGEGGLQGDDRPF